MSFFPLFTIAGTRAATETKTATKTCNKPALYFNFQILNKKRMAAIRFNVREISCATSYSSYKQMHSCTASFLEDNFTKLSLMATAEVSLCTCGAYIRLNIDVTLIPPFMLCSSKPSPQYQPCVPH